jgi:hypothetical protein
MGNTRTVSFEKPRDEAMKLMQNFLTG